MAERAKRTMVSSMNSGHFTHFPSVLFAPARHVVYFIALLALLHQPPLHLGGYHWTCSRPLASLPVRAEHHSTRIKYWLRFWFIVIAGGNGEKVRWNGPEGEALSDGVWEGSGKGTEWMGEAQTGRFSRVDGGVEASGGGGKPFPRRFRSLTDAFAKALRTFLARSTSSRGMLLLSYVFI